MTKGIFILPFFLYLAGCTASNFQITHKPTLMKKNQRNTLNKKIKEKKEGDATFAKTWVFVLNKKHSDNMYSGIEITQTNPDDFYRFSVAINFSNTHTLGTGKDITTTPDGLQIIIPEENLAEVNTDKRETDVIVTPVLSIPLLRCSAELGFVPSRVYIKPYFTIRAGIGYDWYIHYKHGGHKISLLEGEEKKITIPSGISTDGYLSIVTSAELDIKPLHTALSMTNNMHENKISLLLGFIW